MDKQVCLQVKNIDKSFPGVRALDGVSLTVKRGSVHAICGENGAGKSTLMKIISGIYQPDAGEVWVNGQEVQIKNPIAAQHLGIAMIAQELNFVPEMSIEENLFLGRLPRKKWSIDWKKVREDTAAMLNKEGLAFDPGEKMKNLSVSEIQQIEILKALALDAQIIVMDEPTSSITEEESKKLFAKIRSLVEQNKSVIYISHKLDEIFEIADEVTVLRDGQLVSTRPIAKTNMEKVISEMVGRTLQQVYPKEEVAIGEELLRIENLSQTGEFKDISFYLREGEIIGFAGLVGSGRTEVMRAIFGLGSWTEGQILVKGKALPPAGCKAMIQSGMGMVTEDRKRSGIVPVRGIRENASLASLEKFFVKGRYLDKKERELCSHYFERMDVKAPGMETEIQYLSGGNQQKVILAKWMMREPSILILDEPTRGIDVGNKYAIYRLMGEFAKEGKGIIMVSSELPELLGMCDRIYVMNQGTITGEVPRASFDQELIMKYATMQ